VRKKTVAFLKEIMNPVWICLEKEHWDEVEKRRELLKGKTWIYQSGCGGEKLTFPSHLSLYILDCCSFS